MSHTVKILPNGVECSCGYTKLATYVLEAGVVDSIAALHLANPNARADSRHMSVTRVIYHPEADGGDPTSFGRVAPDIEQIECLVHDRHANVMNVVNNVVGVEACCNSLLDAIDARIRRSRVTRG